uniref:small ribosomal subunit protein uS17m n=1 Tax=Myxine glutinosa TaxID=7769 RepID=UPI00358F6093
MASAVKKPAAQAVWIVGKVVGTKMWQTAKVHVTRLVLDKYLTKFYNKRKTYFAHDPEHQCRVGDVVLLHALVEPLNKNVKHRVAEIVFKAGAVVDPMTGMRCAGRVFLDDPQAWLQSQEQHLSRVNGNCLEDKDSDAGIGSSDAKVLVDKLHTLEISSSAEEVTSEKH